MTRVCGDYWLSEVKQLAFGSVELYLETAIYVCQEWSEVETKGDGGKTHFIVTIGALDAIVVVEVKRFTRLIICFFGIKSLEEVLH